MTSMARRQLRMQITPFSRAIFRAISYFEAAAERTDRIGRLVRRAIASEASFKRRVIASACAAKSFSRTPAARSHRFGPAGSARWRNVPLNTTRSKPDRVPMTEPACLAENGFTASPASGSARSCKTQTIRIEDGAPYQRFGCGQRPRCDKDGGGAGSGRTKQMTTIAPGDARQVAS